METVFALFLRIFSNPFSNVVQKKLILSAYTPLCVNFLTYFGLSLVCLCFAGQINFVELNPNIWFSAIFGGFCGALGNSFLIKALEKGNLSVLGPINSYKAVVAMIFGIFVLKEIPSYVGLLGIILIIWGSYVVFETQEEGFSFKLLKRKDIRYRIYALIFTAIEAVFIKNVIVASDVLTSFVFWCWFGALFSFMFLSVKREVITFSLKAISMLLVLILTTGIMQWSTNYVFDHMNVSYALALFQLSTILSVIFGWRFFDEKDIKKKLLGSFIMVIGAVILILFK